MTSDPAVVLRVTLDTNAIDHRGRIEAACAGLDVELAYTTVTDRETEGTSRATSGASVVETGVWNESRWDQFIWGDTVRETAVIGEWRLGEAVLGSTEGASRFEAILAVMGDGGFPASGKRESLTPGHRRQLRDAMILEAHSRDGRDVLVTQNTTDFIKHGRGEQLEALCKTRIMTVDEFCDSVAALAS